MKTVVVGDIHGCYAQFAELVQTIEAEEGPCAWYTTGDLIDRGPDSKQVMELACSLGMQGTIGNHELWFMRFMTEGWVDASVYSKLVAGKATLDSYGVVYDDGEEDLQSEAMKIPIRHIQWLYQLQMVRTLSVEGKHYLLSHAGVSKTRMDQIKESFTKHGKPFDELTATRVLAQIAPHCLLMEGVRTYQDRKPGWDVYLYEDRVQIFGHTPQPGVKKSISEGEKRTGFIALDTGAGTAYQKGLSAIILPDERVVTIYPS